MFKQIEKPPSGVVFEGRSDAFGGRSNRSPALPDEAPEWPEIVTLDLEKAQPSDRLIRSLQEQITEIEASRRQGGRRVPFCLIGSRAATDAAENGKDAPGVPLEFRWGTLVEWLSAAPGGGAQTLAVCTAREACRQGGVLVVLDRCGSFYPPAAVRMGIEPEKMLVVRTGKPSDYFWALDQALRCPAVAAALAWPEKLDGHTFRRLQLAAEEGDTLGLLIRLSHARGEPSWADLRLLVEPLPSRDNGRRLKIEVLRSRGSTGGGSVELEVDDETYTLHPAGRLARPAAHRRAARA